MSSLVLAGLCDLNCSGGRGPAPEWEVGITVAGIGDTVPAALVENAQVELALHVERMHLPVTAFSLGIGGALQLGGLDGSFVDVDDETGGEPKGLWPGARITNATAQRCAHEEPLPICGPPVGRNLLSFVGFDQDLEVFDHQSAQTAEFEMRVGDALVIIDDGEPWDCGGPIERYQFLILRKD